MKKCMPMNLSGREVPAASMVMETERGVAGDDGIFRQLFIQFLEDALFDLHVFRSRFDGQMHIAGFRSQIHDPMDPGHGSILVFFRDTALGDTVRQAFFDFGNAPVDEFLFDIPQGHFYPMSSHDLCNTAAHLASADYHNFLQFHSNRSPFCLINEKILNPGETCRRGSPSSL